MSSFAKKRSFLSKRWFNHDFTGLLRRQDRYNWVNLLNKWKEITNESINLKRHSYGYKISQWIAEFADLLVFDSNIIDVYLIDPVWVAKNVVNIKEGDVEKARYWLGIGIYDFMVILINKDIFRDKFVSHSKDERYSELLKRIIAHEFSHFKAFGHGRKFAKTLRKLGYEPEETRWIFGRFRQAKPLEDVSEAKFLYK